MSRLEQQVCGAVDNTSALPTAPQTQQQQQKRRTYDSLLKADICTRYRQHPRLSPQGNRVKDFMRR